MGLYNQAVRTIGLCQSSSEKNSSYSVWVQNDLQHVLFILGSNPALAAT